MLANSPSSTWLARRANAALRVEAIGTPSYVAPEQARGEEILDSRADIYSLGATLFHMVTGHHPFYGTTSRILTHQVFTPPRAPREINARLSSACSGLITRMMSKAPAQRQQSPAELMEEIHLVLEGQGAVVESAPTAEPDGGSREPSMASRLRQRKRR